MKAVPGAMRFLLVDKPAGVTSHDVVAAARRGLGVRKVGHAGTLDPFATGLLVLAVGKATRLLEYLVGFDKTYRATARLGAATDSHDRDGVRIAEDDNWTSLKREQLEAAAAGMVGRMSQVPPVYSAVKVDGVPAHRRARRGERVVLSPRQITLGSFEILDYVPPRVLVRVACSSGTYVRSLSVEFGKRLGTSCHLAELRRTRVGSLHVRHAASLASVEAGEPRQEAWVGAVSALSHLPRVDVGVEEAAKLADGRRIRGDVPDRSAAIFVLPGEQLVAVGAVRDGVLQPRKVFHEPGRPGA